MAVVEGDEKLMSFVSSFTDDIKAKLSDDDCTKLELLRQVGVYTREQSEKTFPNEFATFDSPTRRIVGISPGGMGHYHLMCMNPTIDGGNRFFTQMVGGSNGHDREANYRKEAFRREFSYTNLRDFVYFGFMRIEYGVGEEDFDQWYDGNTTIEELLKKVDW